jgi:putative ABC transport system permease protein
LADEANESALDEARRLPGVDRAEPLFSVAGTFFSGPYQRKGAIIGLSPDAQLTVPYDARGRPVAVPESGLVMSRKLAEILHVTVGDDLVFRPAKGLRRRHSVPLAKVTDDYLGMAVYADIHHLSRLVGEELAINGLQLQTNPTTAAMTSADPASVARRPEFLKARRDLYRELKHLPALQAVNERADVIKNLQENYIEVQNIFIVMLTFFAGVIFFGSILTASLIGLAERRREVATFEVLGYTQWQIGGLFLRESLLVNLMGAVCGLPLGYLLTYLISVYYDTELFRFPVLAPPRVWINTLVLSIAFALLAHLFLQRAVSRTDWVEALNVKE